MFKKIPVEVSARHVHLSQSDLERLFGKDYKLKELRALTLPGEFAAKEEVKLKGKKLRVIGPVREYTQVELSVSDAIKLDIKPVLRVSGNIKRTPGAVLIGPKGKVRMKKGVIIAQRHIHCTPKEAKKLGLRNRQSVSIKIKGQRELIFKKVRVRVSDKYKLCCHLDTDEGNAAGINKKAKGILV